METNLSKLDWNPQTCDCKLEMRREETVLRGHEVHPYRSEDRLTLAALRATDPQTASRIRIVVTPERERFVVHPMFETVYYGLDCILWRTTHGLDEIDLHPGIRLRAGISEACPAHEDFEDVLQVQRVSAPQVCRCKWLEIRAGNMKENGLFGTRVEELCYEHADLELAHIPGLIRNLANAIVPPEPVYIDAASLRIVMRGDTAFLLVRDATGREHEAPMRQAQDILVAADSAVMR